MAKNLPPLHQKFIAIAMMCRTWPTSLVLLEEDVSRGFLSKTPVTGVGIGKMAVAGSLLLRRLNVVRRKAANEVRVRRTDLAREDAHFHKEQLLGKGSGILSIEFFPQVSWPHPTSK